MTSEEREAARAARASNGIAVRTISAVQTVPTGTSQGSVPPPPAAASLEAPDPNPTVLINENMNQVARMTRNGSVVPVSQPTRDPRVLPELFRAPVSIAATQRLATYKNKSKSLLVGKKQSKEKDEKDSDDI